MSNPVEKITSSLKPKLPTEVMFRPSIQVMQVHKEFVVGENTIPVLKGMDFNIVQGDFAMIVGPSGCGKSTLLNIINGWMTPSSGQVLIQGKDIYAMTEDQRTAMAQGLVSMIHQSSFWVKSLSVLENISMPFLLSGKSKTEAYERGNKLLAILSLERYGHYRPMHLSGGQQQRISFLRALINNPKIIMADEPTGNLDTKTSVVVMDLFKQINEKFNRTLIMVTHNMELLEYASKVIRILDGKVVEVKENLKPKQRVMGMMGDLVDLVGSEVANPAQDLDQPMNAEEALAKAKLEEKMKKEGKS